MVASCVTIVNYQNKEVEMVPSIVFFDSPVVHTHACMCVGMPASFRPRDPSSLPPPPLAQAWAPAPLFLRALGLQEAPFVLRKESNCFPLACSLSMDWYEKQCFPLRCSVEWCLQAVPVDSRAVRCYLAVTVPGACRCTVVSLGSHALSSMPYQHSMCSAKEILFYLWNVVYISLCYFYVHIISE